MSIESAPWRKHYGTDCATEIPKITTGNIAAFLKEVPQGMGSPPSSSGQQSAFVTCMPNGMNGQLTFQQTEDMSDIFAIYLREILKLEAGDRVALQMPNCLAYPVAALGVLKAGCVLVNTNPLYTAPEMRHQFSDAGVKCLVIIDMFADKYEAISSQVQIPHVVICQIWDFFPSLVGRVIYLIQKYWNHVIPKLVGTYPLFTEALSKTQVWLKQQTGTDRQKLVSLYAQQIKPDSVAVLQYTGGTTGVSKGATLTHQNIIANILQVTELLKAKIDFSKECVLTALPLYHIFAFTVNFMMFYKLRSQNILIPSPRPLSNLKRAFENYPITWLTAVNTLLNGLCNEFWFTDSPPKKLKATAAGGMALQKAVAEKWEALTSTAVVEGYGLSESSPVLTFNPLGGIVKRETIGIPLPSTLVKCVTDDGKEVPLGEAGEIWAQGPQIMKGYWNKPDETAKALTPDGWLKTGDIGVMDQDGFFKIVDRKKDMILVSGFNVYPNEVEDCLAQHPGILESAVIGVPDGESGEAVRAYVVLKEGESLKKEEILAHCRQRLTSYKVPKQIAFRAEIPKSNVGKILRKELRKELANG